MSRHNKIDDDDAFNLDKYTATADAPPTARRTIKKVPPAVQLPAAAPLPRPLSSREPQTSKMENLKTYRESYKTTRAKNPENDAANDDDDYIPDFFELSFERKITESAEKEARKAKAAELWAVVRTGWVALKAEQADENYKAILAENEAKRRTADAKKVIIAAATEASMLKRKVKKEYNELLRLSRIAEDKRIVAKDLKGVFQENFSIEQSKSRINKTKKKSTFFSNLKDRVNKIFSRRKSKGGQRKRRKTQGKKKL
jgi:hypothetical protein